MFTSTIEQRNNPELRRLIDDMLGQDETVEITADGIKDHFLLVTNQRLAIIQGNVKVWGADDIRIGTRNILLRDIVRVEVHNRDGECHLELVLRKKDDPTNPFARLERSIPFDHIHSKNVVKLAIAIEEKIQQFTDQYAYYAQPTQQSQHASSSHQAKDLPPMANVKQLANILDQALLKAVIKREA